MAWSHSVVGGVGVDVWLAGAFGSEVELHRRWNFSERVPLEAWSSTLLRTEDFNILEGMVMSSIDESDLR